LWAYFFIIRTDSTIDALTGIGNRYAFSEFIDKLSRQGAKGSSRSPEPYSIAMIDMDDFKKINDTYGHSEGDNALRDMAAIIKECTRRTDFAARYGGDEFVIAAPAKYNIGKVLARLQEAMDQQNEKHDRPYKMKMSYGLDVYQPGGSVSIGDFMNRIDAMMYRQKAYHKRTDQK
jgi:diguanylate cyclase (GGDEF)-like protein